jgi:aspartate/methionine/tyrosine aminotransferase
MCQTAPSKVISITRIMPCSIESSWDIMVLSDEIYRQLQFEGKQLSIMQVPGMKDRQDDSAGWLFKEVRNDRLRMGFGVMRADLAAQMARLMANSNSCTASFTQQAGID